MRLFILFFGCFLLNINIYLLAQTPSISVLEQLAQEAIAQTCDHEAEIKYRKQILGEVIRLHEKKSETYFNALLLLAKAHFSNAEYNQAITTYKQILTELKHPSGLTNTAIYADAMTGLGSVYFYKDETETADSIWHEALALHVQSTGKHSEHYAQILYWLGFLESERGNFKNAETLCNESLSIYNKTNKTNTLEYAKILRLRAYIYRSINQFHHAEEYYLKYKDLVEKIGNTCEYPLAVQQLAGFYRYVSQYEKAISLYQESKFLLEKNNLKDHPYYAKNANGLAMTYADMGKYHQAEPLYEEAGRIFKQHFGEEHTDYAQNRHVLAILYWQTDRLEQAENTYLKVLPTQKKLLGETHFLYSLSLNNLAGIYLSMGELDKAEEIYQQVYRNWSSTYNGEHPDCALALANLATIYYQKKQYTEALQYCMQALAANSPDIDSASFFSDEFVVGLSSHKHYSQRRNTYTMATLFDILGALYKQTNDIRYLETQYKITQTIIAINERVRRDFSSESDKLRVLESNADFLQLGIGIAYQLGEKSNNLENFTEVMFHFSEQNKSALLADALQNHHAHRFGDLPDSLVKREHHLQIEKNELKKQVLEETDNNKRMEAQARLNKLEIEVEQFQKILSAQYPRYHQMQYQSHTTALAEVQKSLSPQSAMLEYFVADTVIYVFQITNTSAKVLAIVMDMEALDSMTSQLRRCLSDYEFVFSQPEQVYEDYIRAAAWFYQKLMRVPLQGLSGIEHLIIVPDGILGHLPFEAFLVEMPTQHTDYQNLHYLLHDYEISYSFSAALWEQSQHKIPSRYQSVLAMAAHYPDSDSVLWQHRNEHLRGLRSSLADIPDVQTEVERLSKLLSGDFLYRQDANEAAFKERANQYAVLHFAMHGLLNHKTPLLSGLMFSETPDSTEDNFLQAWEISQMELTAALVVLSACETGYGKFQQGEGVMSLGRAFMYAGVPSLLVSLWSVNDHSTAQIMSLFYDNLSKSQTKAKALQQAKSQYIKEAKGIYAHPAFWSPFIQIGDNSSIALHRQNNFLPYLVMLGVFGVFLAILMFANHFIRKRKINNKS